MPISTAPSYVTKIGALIETYDVGLYVTKTGAYVEVLGSGLLVTQFGCLVELQEIPEEEPSVPTYFPRAGGARASLHQRLPDELTGYAFDPAHSWWSAVVPEASENLVSNPSVETGSTGYSQSGMTSLIRNSGGVIGASRGVYALEFVNVASSEGYVAYTVPSQAAGAYTWSLDVYVPLAGTSLRLDLIAQGVTTSRVFTFRYAGWQRIAITRIIGAASTLELRLVSPAVNTRALTWRTDGWQVENKAYPTTYFDGDSIGWFDVQANQSYSWTGLPHAATSTRKAKTGSGGRIVYFHDLIEGVDFQTTAIVGAGMPPTEVDAIRVAYEREIPRGVRILPRDFTITGRIIACDFDSLRRGRKQLIEILRPNHTIHREPLILRYQETDDIGRELSMALEIVCAYREGLQGNITNLYQETIGLQFHASDPYWAEDIDSAYHFGGSLAEDLASNRIIYRDEDGVYQNLGSGSTDAPVRFVAFDMDGVPLAAGAFTSIGGDAISYLAQWNGTNWVVLGAAPDASANIIAVIPETNYILVGGTFANIGATPVANIGYYDGSSWAQLAAGFSPGDFVLDIEYDRYSQNIFVGGQWSGTSDNIQYAAISDVAWTDLPRGGLSGQVRTVVSTHDGNVYMGGSFSQTSDASLTLNRVVRYNIDDDEFYAMDSGFNGVVHKLLAGRDGFIYAFGGFTRDGDDSYDLFGVARWNGTTWEPVPGYSDSALSVDAAAVDTNGVLWTVSDSIQFETVFGNSYMIGYQSGVFYPQFIVIPSDINGFQALAFGDAGQMLLAAADESVTPTYAPKQFEITVSGDADAKPIFVFRNKQTPLIIENLDAETAIYFREGFVIADNERMLVNLSGFRPRIYSDSRPNLLKHIYTGASNISTFALRPGINRISLLCVETTGAVAASASLIWRNRYLSSDSVGNL